MKNKKFIITTVAGVVVIGGFWLFSGSKAQTKIEFATQQVQRQNISNSCQSAVGFLIQKLKINKCK